MEEIVKDRQVQLGFTTWFLGVKAGVDEHLHEARETLVSRPVQS